MHSRYLTNTSTPNTSPKHTPLHTHTHTIYISISIHPHTRGTLASPPPPPPPPAARHRRHLFAATRYSTCYTDTISIHPHDGTLASPPPPPPPCGAHHHHLFAATRCLHGIPTYYYLPLTTDLPRRSTSHLTTPPSVSLSTSRFRYTSYHNILLHQRVGMDYTSKYLQYIHNTFTTHLIMKYITQNISITSTSPHLHSRKTFDDPF